MRRRSIASLLVVSALLALGSGLRPGPVLAQGAEQAEPAPIYDESADGRELIDQALERAATDNKRVLIQWGANWCGWCRKLHTLMSEDRALARKILYEYEVVLMDIGRFDKHMDLAAELGADLRGNGVPYLTILAADGSVVTNQSTVPFENDTKDASAGHDPQKLLEWLTEHQAAYLDAEAILAEGLRQAEAQGKKVFLHSGAPW